MAITLPPAPQAKRSQHGNEASPKKKKQCRAVTFDESANVSYDNMHWTAEESRRLWYTPFDYRQIKQAAHGLAKQIYKRERRHANDNVVLRVHDICCAMTHEQWHDFSGLSNDLQSALTNYMARGHHRTGLERLYLRELAVDKKQRRQFLADVVVASDQPQSAADALTSQAVSRASRLFAHHMAVALQNSLYHTADDDKSCCK